MRDDERRASLHQERERLLDAALGVGIERGRGFVEDQDRSVLEEGAGDRDALTLAAGKAPAPLADLSEEAFGLGLDEFQGSGHAGGLADLGVAGGRTTQADVLEDRLVEEDGLLRDQGDIGAQVGLADAAEIVSVDKDRPLLRIEEARDQVDEGALAGAARTDERDGLSGGDLQGHVGQDRISAIAERDAAHLKVSAHAGERAGMRVVRDLDGREDDLFEADKSWRGHAETTRHAAEALDGAVGEVEGDDQRDQLLHGEAVHRADGDGRGDSEGGGDLDHRRKSLLVTDQLALDPEAFLAGLVEALRFAFLQAVGAHLAGRLQVLDRDAVQVGSGFHALARAALDTHANAPDEKDRGGHDQEAGQEPVALLVRETYHHHVAQCEDHRQRLDDQVVRHVDQHEPDGIGVGDQAGKEISDRQATEEAEVQLLQLREDIATDGFDHAQACEIEKVRRKELADAADEHDDRQEGDGEGHLMSFGQIESRLSAQPLRPSQERRGARGLIAKDGRQHFAHQERQAEGVGRREDERGQQGKH